MDLLRSFSPEGEAPWLALQERPMPVEILENQEQPPVLSPARGVDVAILDLKADPPATGFIPTAGDRLQRGLEMDRKLREARTRVLQRRINRAHGVETRARSACVWAGLGSIPIWGMLLTPVMPVGGSPLAFLLQPLWVLGVIVALVVGITLPVAAIVAIAAGRWRRHLLRAAGVQHLEVRDPGKADYR